MLLSLAACGKNNSETKQNARVEKDSPLHKSSLAEVPVVEHRDKMDTKVFWQIIDKANQEAAGNEVVQEASLIHQLAAYSEADIVEFEKLLRQTLQQADDYQVMAALKIIQGWVTDDSYLYFRCWLIGQGQATFLAALKNPESLVEKADKGSFPSFESLLSVADEAYSKKTGKTEEDESYPRYQAFEQGVEYDSNTTGTDWTEEQLPSLYPKLWSKFR